MKITVCLKLKEKNNSEPKKNIIQFREDHDHEDYTKNLI